MPEWIVFLKDFFLVPCTCRTLVCDKGFLMCVHAYIHMHMECRIGPNRLVHPILYCTGIVFCIVLILSTLSHIGPNYVAILKQDGTDMGSGSEYLYMCT